jgi:hypothetical protein
MTLCIAAECEHEGAPAVVLCCDWRGETEVVTIEIDKIRWIGDWSVLLAGDVTRADELVGEYEREFATSPFVGPVYDLIERFKKPAQRQKRKLIEEHVALSLGISYGDFLNYGKQWFTDTIYYETYNEIRRLSLDADLILCSCTRASQI